MRSRDPRAERVSAPAPLPLPVRRATHRDHARINAVIRSPLSILRAFRLGLTLARLEAAERRGAAICLHSSWCAAPGAGFWIALVRPGEWAEVPLGRSIVGTDLLS